ncbi:MAG: ROK family protein, partial [Patescibacteria group bacterium]
RENERRILETIKGYGAPIKGIGMSIAGGLNEDRTALVGATYLPQWVGQPIAKVLQKRFSCPTAMNHDAWCSALAEAQRRDSDFLFLVYGTGIGGAVVTRRTAGTEIRKLSREEHAAHLRPWQEVCGGRTLEAEFEKPASRLSDAEWDAVMDRFGQHFIGFVRHFKPKTVVFGGGVAIKQWSRLERAVDTLKQRHAEIRGITVAAAQSGEDAGLLGAVTLLDKEVPIIVYEKGRHIADARSA